VRNESACVQELEVVAQRMLLLQEQLEAKERQLEQQGNTSANTMMVPILVSVCVRTCVFVSIRVLRTLKRASM
jgi:hypothetical protein